MDDYPYDDLKLPAREITVYSNGDYRVSVQIKMRSNITFKELEQEITKKLRFKNVQTFRLFDTHGIELFNEDIELIKEAATLYASEGDDFDHNSKFSEYKIIKELGRGGFGKVVLATHRKTHQNVAIKIVTMDKHGSVKDMDRVFAEAEMLKALTHENIVKILNFYSLSNMEFVFVMEYLEGGELAAFVKERGSLSEEEAKHFFKQLLSAIEYCHNEKLIHRDLKLENILLENKTSLNIKVVDFGIAGVVSSLNSDPTEAGSIRYLAPEVVSGKDIDASPALDVWAMGCILYHMLHGKPAFGGKTRKEISSKIISGDYCIEEQVVRQCSAELIDLMKKMLTVDHKRRITILEILKHPWIVKDNLAPKKEIIEPIKEEKKVLEKTRVSSSISMTNSPLKKTASASRLSTGDKSGSKGSRTDSNSPSSGTFKSTPFTGLKDLSSFLRNDKKDNISRKSTFFNL